MSIPVPRWDLGQWSTILAPKPIQRPAGDFNGDGELDFAVSYVGGGLSIFLGHGDGTFTQGQTYSTLSYLPSMAVTDLNGDGISDLVTADQNAGEVIIF